MKEKPKSVYIVGMPRSGTTWLISLLAEQPQVLGVQQSGFFHALQPLKKWWSSSGGFGKKILTSSTTDTVSAESNATFVGDVFSDDEFAKLVQPIIAFVDEKLASVNPQASVVVDQTPENMLMRELIKLVDPQAHFLHIVRDPRSVCSSVHGANLLWGAKFSRRTSAIARQWVAYQEAADQLRAFPQNYYEVRYEDLIQNGAETLAGVYAWLGIEASEGDCLQAIKNCAIDKLRQRNLGPNGFFRSGNIDTWHSDLSNQQIATVEYLAADYMSRYGYETVTNVARVPALLKIEEIQASISVRLRNVVRTIRNFGRSIPRELANRKSR